MQGERDGGKSQSIELMPGQVEWEEPIGRIHRSVTVGQQPYERFASFLLDRPDT